MPDINLEWLQGALSKYENKPSDTHHWGLVTLVNEDGSYQVKLNSSDTTTRCANACTASVGDRVLVLVKTDGKCVAVSRLGGEGGGTSTVGTNLDATDWLAGKIFPYAGTDTPAGSLLCDGSAVSRSEYWELFAAIGTTYGEGNGSTTFNLPNIESRVIIGESDDYALGSTGGEETHTLTVEEIPAHGHTNPYAYAWGSGDGGATGYDEYRAFTSVGNSWNRSTGSTGGGEPHNNMQPYIVMRYFITTGKGDPVSGINPADYVVEWGQTDGWYWEKWASGKAVCRKRIAHKITAWGAWGGIYEGTSIPSQTYPFEFAELPAFGVRLANNSGSQWIAGFSTDPLTATTTTSPKACPLRGSAGVTGETFYVVLEAEGFWKTPSESGGAESIAPTIDERFKKLETDYIVAEGTSGIWVYRKWASGVAECWGYESMTSASLTTNVASGVYTNDTWKAKTVALPFEFTSLRASSMEIYSNGYTHCQSLADVSNSNAKTSIVVRVWGSYSQSPSMKPTYYVIGTWK